MMPAILIGIVLGVGFSYWRLNRLRLRSAWKLGVVILLMGGLGGFLFYRTATGVPCFPNCVNETLINRNLSGRNFNNGIFSGADMRGADLSNTNLQSADLSGANLQNANLTGADLRSALLIGSNLTGAELVGARLTNTSLRGANLTEANLSSIDLTKTKLRGANLSNATLVDVILTNLDLGGSLLHGANLSGAELNSVRLDGAMLSLANLSGVTMYGARLQGASLNLATLTGADLSFSNLSGSTLIGANLSSANLQSAELSGVLTTGAEFFGADLRNAQMAQMRNFSEVRPEDVALDPTLATLNALQLAEINKPGNFSGVIVNAESEIGESIYSPSSAETLSAEDARQTVEVGLLYSLSGSGAFFESAAFEATLLAINEINEQGGVLGHRIVPIAEDGATDPAIFANRAAKLLEDEQLNSVFGVWTSEARQAVASIFESNNGLLFHAAQHEGFTQSDNLLHLGQDTSQQIVPTVAYLLEQGFDNFYIVRSQNAYADVARRIIVAQLIDAEAQVLGDFAITNTSDIAIAVEEIAFLKPSIVLNLLDRSVTGDFFDAFKDEQLLASSTPVLSFGVDELTINAVGADKLVGHLVAAGYYQTISSVENLEFIASYKQLVGDNRLATDAIASSYAAVYLWKTLVEAAGSFDVSAIQSAAQTGIGSIDSPIGALTLSPTTLHVARTAYVGRIRSDGLVDIVYTSPTPIAADPFLTQHTWAQSVEGND